MNDLLLIAGFVLGSTVLIPLVSVWVFLLVVGVELLVAGLVRASLETVKP